MAIWLSSKKLFGIEKDGKIQKRCIEKVIGDNAFEVITKWTGDAMRHNENSLAVARWMEFGKMNQTMSEN